MLLAMWRQYTREHPARPKLALAGTGLALAVSVGFAHLMTSNAPGGGGPQSLQHWPIVFEVPPTFWRQSIPNGPQAIVGNSESSGEAYFVQDDPALGKARLKIAFKFLPKGTSPKEAALELLGQELETVYRIRMGPLSGYLLQPAPDTELIHALAVGCSPDGLAVAVECTTLRAGSMAEETVLAVCKSVVDSE